MKKIILLWLCFLFLTTSAYANPGVVLQASNGDEIGTPSKPLQVSVVGGGGTITTSANQVIVGTGENTAAGNANLTFDGTTLTAPAVSTPLPPGEQTLRLLMDTPTTASDYNLGAFPGAMTIDNIYVLSFGSTMTGGFSECDANGANCVAVDADIVGIANTQTADDGSLTNPGIASGNTLKWLTTSVGGVVTSAVVWIKYHF